MVLRFLFSDGSGNTISWLVLSILCLEWDVIATFSWGKAPLQLVQTLDVSEEESDEGTDVDVYLNTTMFSTQPVRIF
jgi:hypothetical protein